MKAIEFHPLVIVGMGESTIRMRISKQLAAEILTRVRSPIEELIQDMTETINADLREHEA